MPHVPTRHADHDPLLVAAYAAGDATGTELDAAQALVAACPDCATLHHDLRAIAAALPALPDPVRRRDFRLAPEQAAALHPAGWRRLLDAFAGPRFRVRRPPGHGPRHPGPRGPPRRGRRRAPARRRRGQPRAMRHEPGARPRSTASWRRPGRPPLRAPALPSAEQLPDDPTAVPVPVNGGDNGGNRVPTVATAPRARPAPAVLTPATGGGPGGQAPASPDPRVRVRRGQGVPGGRRDARQRSVGRLARRRAPATTLATALATPAAGTLALGLAGGALVGAGLLLVGLRVLARRAS